MATSLLTANDRISPDAFTCDDSSAVEYTMLGKLEAELVAAKLRLRKLQRRRTIETPLWPIKDKDYD